MRLLFIHEVNYATKVIFEMHEFPELLAHRGHDVTFFHYPEGGGKSALRTTRSEITGRAYSDTRLTLVTPPTFGGGALERLVAPILDLPALRREIRTGAYDAIVLYAVPTTGWQTIGIARRAGVPVVFRALDVSHEIRRSVFTPLIKLAERAVYKGAALLSANNPALAQYCVEFSGREGPVAIDLPPVDLGHFEQAVEDLRPRYGLRETDRVIAYMGSFFDFSGLDDVLTALVPAFEADPDLRLLLIGGGELEPRLRELREQNGLQERVLFTGIVPYADLPAHLAIADVAINPFRSLRVTNVAFPHKVLQYMAAGIPAVSTSLTGLRGVLGDDVGVRWGETPQDVARLALALLDTTPEERAGIALAQRAFVDATFSRERAAEGLEQSIRTVV